MKGVLTYGAVFFTMMGWLAGSASADEIIRPRPAILYNDAADRPMPSQAKVPNQAVDRSPALSYKRPYPPLPGPKPVLPKKDL